MSAHRRRPNQHWFCCINIPPKVSLPTPPEERTWTKSKTCCFHFSEWINYGYVCKFFNMILWFCKNWLQALFKYWQRLVYSYKAVQNPRFQFAITLDGGKIQPNCLLENVGNCLLFVLEIWTVQLSSPKAVVESKIFWQWGWQKETQHGKIMVGWREVMIAKSSKVISLLSVRVWFQDWLVLKE